MRSLRTTASHLQLQQRNLTYLTLKPPSPSASPLRSFHLISRNHTHPSPKLINKTYSTHPNTRTTPKPTSQPPGVEPPVFDLNALGIKGPVKVVVIVVVCVLGTVETVFWIKVGWRWWMGEGDGQVKEDGDGEMENGREVR